MKRKVKTTAALCVSTLIAIAGCLACMCLSHHTAYAEEACNQSHEESVQFNTPNINGLSIFSSFSTIETYGNSDNEDYENSYYVDSLLGSTVYGDWDDSLTKYNCYAYVMGKTDNFLYIGQASNNKVLHNPFSGFIMQNIKELAEYTVQDLKCMGYECVNIEKNWFYEPYFGQTLICLRKSFIDYHFMKYVDGEWLHKPGSTWILKYNGTPSADVNWYAEGTKIDYNGIQHFERNEDYPYTGDIYFIKYANSHNYSTYTYYSASQHEVKCNNCETVLQKEPHIFKPYNEKAKQCKKCGFILYDSGFGQIIMKDEDKLV